MATTTFDQVRSLSKVLNPHEKLRLIDDLIHELMQSTSPVETKPYRSIRGILANSGPVPSIEDIKEMRREALANFPREELFE